ncbi:hypothetical protein LguiB_000973 [Lonicera macranthoides]
MRGGTKFVIVLVVLMVIAVATTTTFAANVSYDHRALVIDGKRRVLISGSIHYPRSTPEMWPDLIQKSKDGGLDVIETYVFWNLHEPVRKQAEMKRFTAKIVDLMKQEKLYASQGGPIILSQIENEYGNVDSLYGPAAKTYIRWAASMANSLDTGVPWVMCQQADAPDPMEKALYIKYVLVALQQYHGGTNFERTTGGPFIATTYDYDAPIDEYAMFFVHQRVIQTFTA